MPHYQITIPIPENETRELLIAQLAELGYEGFEESEEELKAYIEEVSFVEQSLKEIIELYSLSSVSYTHLTLPTILRV